MSWELPRQLLTFEEHSLVHFSSDLCRTQSLISFISPLNCYLWKRVFPDSLYLKHTWYPHLCHNISASLHPTLHFCSIFQLPFHYILCLLSSVNTVYCLRSSFTEPAAPASCSLLTPSTCQGTTTWEACSEYLLNKWMIVEQSRDCNPRLSASKIHAIPEVAHRIAHSGFALVLLSLGKEKLLLNWSKLHILVLSSSKSTGSYLVTSYVALYGSPNNSGSYAIRKIRK